MVAQRVAHISRTTLITSLGTGVDTHYERMHSGSSGAGKPMQCPPLIEGLTRLETLICHATTEVLPTHIGGRTALIISTTKGDIDYIHSRNPLDFDACKHYLSAHYATLAQPLAYLTVSNACISGVAAVIVADRLIRSGKYDNIVVRPLRCFLAAEFAMNVVELAIALMFTFIIDMRSGDHFT